MLLATSVAPHHHHHDHICFAAVEQETDAGEMSDNASSDETACPLNIRAALAEKASPLTAGQHLTAISVTTLPVVPADDSAPAERRYSPFAARIPLVLLTRDNPLRAPPVA